MLISGWIVFADNQTWHVDDMGRSSVLWLDFRSDDSEQESQVEEEVN